MEVKILNCRGLGFNGMADAFQCQGMGLSYAGGDD